MTFVKSMVALGIMLTFLTPSVRAQGKPEPVKFKTADGVTIKGKFYPGENNNAPTVMMLHNVNENSKKAKWLNLAAKLQEKGYAVLTFDFRGHGDSTSVDAETFWKQRFNLMHVPGGPKGLNIDNSKFHKAYYPALVNDIAAAKAFLDKKNDAKECNSSRIILIGAETGATLGALWLKSEWQRYKVRVHDITGKPLVDRFGPIPDTTKPPEGSAVINCLWLSISPTLGSRTVELYSLLYKAAKERGIPMAFVHGKDDKSGRILAKSLENKLVVYKKKGERDDKYKFTAAWEIPDSGKLKGQELLQTKTIQGIVDYLDEATKDRGEDWMEREFRKSAYVWFTGGVPRPVAKLPDAMNLIFNTYEMFLR
jgi:hypothetical protein